MKKFAVFSLCLSLTLSALAQDASTYASDGKLVLETIKSNVFKNRYQYLISFDETQHAAINVKPKTNYLIFYVYDNTNYPLSTCKAYLMTPDNELRKKYTAHPDDLGQVGAARVQRLRFRTKRFGEEGATRPVKLEADPKATIYVFYR